MQARKRLYGRTQYVTVERGKRNRLSWTILNTEDGFSFRTLISLRAEITSQVEASSLPESQLPLSGLLMRITTQTPLQMSAWRDETALLEVVHNDMYSQRVTAVSARLVEFIHAGLIKEHPLFPDTRFDRDPSMRSVLSRE